MEVLRRHYDYTLQHWRDRFAANRARAVAIAGERFCRMWEYYLAAVQVGFRNGSNMVFQLLLSRRIDSVPIIRDFMMTRAGNETRPGDPDRVAKPH
jgi:cyclopropane-fatty-acyl-phospholipid synthase